MRFQRTELPLKIDGEQAARDYFASCFRDSDPRTERLFVAHVDEQARSLHFSHHDGSRQSTDFPLRTIITDAARHGSAGIVLAHNHPSGDARPSEADCLATRRLASAAEALDCTILDHLIFAGNDCVSLRRLGYL
ncbi:MAG TPA: JAB domain-containing protein [Sphingomicrobium sp.]|nr:JAB domain-containing protein [Sphingomicrobium sp.]